MAFNENEMKIRCVIPGRGPRIACPVYEAPVSVRENFIMAVTERKARFIPAFQHILNFTPRAIPDVEARGASFDGGPTVTHPEGFPDMFGVNWIYVDVVGGSMVDGANPVLEDMNDWETVLKWPDVNSWDWAGQHAVSDEYAGNTEQPIVATILNGYFERLISLMGFEGAAVAMIDDEQEDAVHSFLDRLADLYISIIDKLCSEYPQINGITIHDDWGSQRAPFFSLDTVSNMLVPHMKKVSDFIHSKGLFYDMHCCGQVEALLPAMIEIGVDCWSGQPLNNQAAMFEKYGDKITIGITVKSITKDLSDAEIFEKAEEFVDTFMKSDRIAAISTNSCIESPLFFEYVYRLSRERAEKLWT